MRFRDSETQNLLRDTDKSHEERGKNRRPDEIPLGGQESERNVCTQGEHVPMREVCKLLHPENEVQTHRAQQDDGGLDEPIEQKLDNHPSPRPGLERRDDIRAKRHGRYVMAGAR